MSCLNHLFPAHLDRGIALALAQVVIPTAVSAQPIGDEGFVAFEVIGSDNRLHELRCGVRGLGSTSLDALLVARLPDGTSELIAIEWKYTERPSRDQQRHTARTDKLDAIYRQTIELPGSPLQVNDPDALFYEPFYQFMRGCLLVWRMAQGGEYGARAWRHVAVVAMSNPTRSSFASPPAARPITRSSKGHLMRGDVVAAWRGMIRAEDRCRFVLLTPSELLSEVDPIPERWAAWRAYLRLRYGT